MDGIDRLAVEDPEAATRVQRELRRVSEEVGGIGGGRPRVVGDSLLATFDHADAAVHAALALRDGFRQLAEVRERGLTLRVAVHVGDVTETESGETFGEAVRVVSSVKTIAEPGQILLTDIAYRLLRQRDAILVEDLGEQELKGVPEPVRVFSAELVRAAPATDLRALLQRELAPLQVLDVEGLGGMGEIYLARDPGLRRTLAVKVLRSELAGDARARARFHREARVVAGLSHPNVVGVHSVGELADGTPYFVMDFVEGGSLRDRLDRDGPLTVAEVRRLVGEVASALAAAHAKGVVHRDVKPSNVLFDAEVGRALVTDWGIAALDPAVQVSPDTRLTRAGTVVGSPEYMSPEQLAGEEVGPASDVYALGLFAYELLAGGGPFQASTPRALMVAHLGEEPPPLGEVRPDADPELESVVASCLAKVPADRPSAEDVARRFAPGAGAVLEWPPPGLESMRGIAFGFTLASLLLAGAVAAPVMLAFLARTSWQGQSGMRDLLFGALGASILFSILVGLTGLLTVLAVAAQRPTPTEMIVTGSARSERGDANPVLRAYGLGYGWRTVLEVAFDRWGDHGNVLAGRREYATIDAEARARVRRRVVWRGIVLVAALTVLPITLIVAAAAVGNGWMTPTTALVVFVGVPLGVWLAAVLVPTDPRPVRRARAALTRRPLPERVLASEVTAWREAAAGVVGDLGSSQGRPTSRRTYWLLVAAQFALALPVYLYVITALIALSLGGVLVRVPVTTSPGSLGRVAGAQGLRLEADPAVTAGDAVRLVDAIVDWDPTVAPWRGQLPDPGRVAGSPLAAAAAAGATGLVALAVLPAVSRGLTEAERVYLAAFAGDPRLPHFDSLARATGYQRGGAELYPPEMLFDERPRRGGAELRTVAGHAVARAGIRLAAGDTLGAEESLRSVYSVGYLVARESNELMEATRGRSVATLGLNALAQLYTDLGRTEKAALAGSPARPRAEVAPGSPWQVWLSRARAVVADTAEMRSLRLEVLHDLLWAFECASIEGLILGLPPDIEALRDTVVTELVRGPSDEPFVTMATQSNARTYRRLSDASPTRLAEELGTDDLLVYRLLRWSGMIFGNPRYVFCPGVLGRD